ncbi:hypothetical protein PAPYR_4609 [Paratrimastix pyriformis]|uniref:Uncharacterized protein n=1 Tax=Paratrimastix pyriformis TaxID=342808 RepID=A0ABQ8UPR5_9EUKA|nr:hypothetical protein PAPYR_4609 [Paratrimastix pyriformis]
MSAALRRSSISINPLRQSASLLTLTVCTEGKTKRRIHITKVSESSNYATFCRVIGAEFPLESIQEITYTKDGDSYAITSDATLEVFIRERPNPFQVNVSFKARRLYTPLLDGGATAPTRHLLAPIVMPGTPPEMVSFASLTLLAEGFPPQVISVPPERPLDMAGLRALVQAHYPDQPIETLLFEKVYDVASDAALQSYLTDSAHENLIRVTLGRPGDVPPTPGTIPGGGESTPHLIAHRLCSSLPCPVPPTPGTSQAAVGESDRMLGQLNGLLRKGAQLRGGEIARWTDSARSLMEASVVSRSRVIEQLVPMLNDPSLLADTEVAANLLKVFWLLAANKTNQLLLGRAGVAEPMVRLLRHPTVAKSPRVIKNLLRACKDINFCNAENRQLFGRAGMPSALVALLDSKLADTNPKPSDSKLADTNPKVCPSISLHSWPTSSWPIPTPIHLSHHQTHTASTRMPLGRYQPQGLYPAFTDHSRDQSLCSSIPQCSPWPHPSSSDRDWVVVAIKVSEALTASIANIAANNPENQAAFTRAGAAEAFVRLLEREVMLANPQVAEYALGAVSNVVAGHETAKTAFGAAGMCPALLGLINHRVVTENVKVAEYLVMALANLCSGHVGNQLLLTQPAPADPAPADIRSLRHALPTVHEHHRAQAGAVPLLVGMLDSPLIAAPGGQVAEYLLRLLMLLSFNNNAAQVAFARAGVAPRLVAMLGQPGLMANGRLGEYLAMTIANLAWNNPECQAAFGQAGIVAPFVSLLGSPALTARIGGEFLLRVLMNVTFHNPENQGLFIRGGVAAPLVALLENPGSNNPKLVESLVGALLNLCSANEEAQGALGKAGAIPPALRLAADAQTLAASVVLDQLMGALWNLATHEPNRVLFAQAEAATVFMQLLRVPLVTGTPRLLEYALGTIRSLTATNPESQTQFGRPEGLVEFVRLFDLPLFAAAVSPTAVLEHLISVLLNLCMNNDEVKHVLGQANVAEPLIRLLTRPLILTSADVTKKLCAAVANLTRVSPENQTAFGPAIEPLVRLCDHFVVLNNPAVAEALLGAIWNLSLLPTNRQAFIEAGLAPALAALQQNPVYSVPPVQNNFVGAVRTLCAGGTSLRGVLEEAGVRIL